jgi:large subunit ribosomal protein L28
MSRLILRAGRDAGSLVALFFLNFRQDRLYSLSAQRGWKGNSNMSKVCAITGKRPSTGNTVSHANKKAKRRFNPNLVTKKIWDPEKRRWVRVRLSTKALKTLDKRGMVL